MHVWLPLIDIFSVPIYLCFSLCGDSYFLPLSQYSLISSHKKCENMCCSSWYICIITLNKLLPITSLYLHKTRIQFYDWLISHGLMYQRYLMVYPVNGRWIDSIFLSMVNRTPKKIILNIKRSHLIFINNK
jgi:hypothetical protein